MINCPTLGWRGKKEQAFDQTEKSVFWNILKSHKGGKIWKTIIESKNNTACRDAWKVVADVFANHINSEFTNTLFFFI